MSIQYMPFTTSAEDAVEMRRLYGLIKPYVDGSHLGDYLMHEDGLGWPNGTGCRLELVSPTPQNIAFALTVGGNFGMFDKDRIFREHLELPNEWIDVDEWKLRNI